MRRGRTDIALVTLLLAFLSLVIALVFFLLTLPNLRLQVKIGDGTGVLGSYELSNGGVTASVWNSGGIIAGAHIITPLSCITAATSENVTCTHDSAEGMKPCAVSVCENVAPEDSIKPQVLILKLSSPAPENFTLHVFADSSVGGIGIGHLEQSWACATKNPAGISIGIDSYMCTELTAK